MDLEKIEFIDQSGVDSNDKFKNERIAKIFYGAHSQYLP